MKLWEERVKELLKQKKSEIDILDILQMELKEENIFSSNDLAEQRISIAQQIINNVKGY